MKTLKIVGGKNFLRICRELDLTEAEKGIARGIVEELDNLLANSSSPTNKIGMVDRAIAMAHEKTAMLERDRRMLVAKAVTLLQERVDEMKQ